MGVDCHKVSFVLRSGSVCCLLSDAVQRHRNCAPLRLICFSILHQLDVKARQKRKVCLQRILRFPLRILLGQTADGKVYVLRQHTHNSDSDSGTVVGFLLPRQGSVSILDRSGLRYTFVRLLLLLLYGFFVRLLLLLLCGFFVRLLLLLFCLCKNEGRKALCNKADLIVYSYVLKLLYLAVISEVAKRRVFGIFHLIALQSYLGTGLFIEDLSFGQADLKGIVKFLLSQLFLQLRDCVGIILVLRIQFPHFQLGGIGKAAVCQGVQDLLRLGFRFVGFVGSHDRRNI